MTITPNVWTAIAAILAFTAAMGWPWIILETVEVCTGGEPDAPSRRRRLALYAAAFVVTLGASAASWHQGISANMEAAGAAPVAL